MNGFWILRDLSILIFFIQPLLPELKIADMWKHAIKFPEFKYYVPDEWILKPEKAGRAFFWGIFSTLQSEYVDILVAESRESRKVRKRDSKHEKAGPLISKKWAQTLLGINFESSKYPPFESYL